MEAVKFWNIGTGSYKLSDNMPVEFRANVGTTGMTGTFDVTGMTAIGLTALKINLGVPITSISATAIAFGATYTGPTGQMILKYWNGLKPAQGMDGGIAGIIGNVGTNNVFSFSDGNGNTATFATGSIKQGEIYPFAIGGTVYQATAGDIIGFSVQ